MEATPQAILGVGIPRHPVAVRPALGEAQARPRRTCSIIDVSVCLSLGRAPLRSLQLTSSAPSLQKVVSTQSARITRAGQRPKCHIIDLSECTRVGRLPCCSRSLLVRLSAQSLQMVDAIQTARITRAGQRRKCHIIDLSECHPIKMRVIAVVRDLWLRRAAGETRADSGPAWCPEQWAWRAAQRNERNRNKKAGPRARDSAAYPQPRVSDVKPDSVLLRQRRSTPKPRVARLGERTLGRP